MRPQRPNRKLSAQSSDPSIMSTGQQVRFPEALRLERRAGTTAKMSRRTANRVSSDSLQALCTARCLMLATPLA